ncbi:MAG TPA: ribosome biogenesis GTP-binding protein YihA/YsxC [Thermotogota bacterium]|nr:ribosome biogenesis GTP-binding protein YihA/YsxC [Thermotogota bacterium]HNR62661.1 ribosome biogenesis GTP-binding protein YihA/YsxC [Thermotogota bacterium]HNT94667.1 ribosome biogenesis GTP-binding protein YihA/YsxC [Thermotogota bacterium]HPB85930.1 ribosome biogenesis GTP-binding protein YihA/YsxC [Thermotogota bacterium]HPH09418.1 ribosome biogenesis GTP-binding protein YihA/YsxC [Thermotogota bacterium]
MPPFFSRIALFRTAFNIKGLIKEGYSQYAFAGRSNVGKSTLLNYLFNQKIAKTSATPGKTRSVNYYLIDELFFCVDLPGYGYAKAAKSEQDLWRKVLESYFENNPALKEVFLLVDSRHLLLEKDEQMIEWLQYLGVPFSFVLTKTDKLTTNQLAKQTEAIKNAYPKNRSVFPVSSLKRTGRSELVAYIDDLQKGLSE